MSGPVCDGCHDATMSTTRMLFWDVCMYCWGKFDLPVWCILKRVYP